MVASPCFSRVIYWRPDQGLYPASCTMSAGTGSSPAQPLKDMWARLIDGLVDGEKERTAERKNEGKQSFPGI